MSYADLRKTSRKNCGTNKYASGGSVKRPGVVVNVIGGQGAAAPGPGPTPPPMPAPPMAPPAPMVPPVAGNAALGAMGAPPALKTGGRVPPKGGAAGGGHRLAMQKK